MLPFRVPHPARAQQAFPLFISKASRDASHPDISPGKLSFFHLRCFPGRVPPRHRVQQAFLLQAFPLAGPNIGAPPAASLIMHRRTAGRRVYHAIKTRTAVAAGDARRKDRNMSFRGRAGFPGQAGFPARIGYPARIGCPARIGFPGRIGIRSYFAFLFLLKLMRQPASTISRSFSVMGLQYRLISVALPSLMT